MLWQHCFSICMEFHYVCLLRVQLCFVHFAERDLLSCIRVAESIVWVISVMSPLIKQRLLSVIPTCTISSVGSRRVVKVHV